MSFISEMGYFGNTKNYCLIFAKTTEFVTNITFLMGRTSLSSSGATGLGNDEAQENTHEHARSWKLFYMR